jgi:Protein of unknown function (DUF3631)
MSDNNTDEKVVQFPHDQTDSEEHKRRILAAAKHLAGGVPGAWTIWFKERAEQLGVEPEVFAGLIKAQIADREKKESKALAEARLGEQRAKRLRLSERDRQREQQRIEDVAKKKSKDKAEGFADIIALPSDQQPIKLAELRKKLDEDVASLTAEFTEYCSTEAPSTSGAMSASEWDIEPWAEPVATAAVLEELIARINRHIKTRQPHQALVIALWVMMAWAHEAAADYSVYLVVTSPETGHGKTTLLVKVIGRLVPKPYASGSNPTEASIFRAADHDKPTMLFDNVDTLFQRKPDVTELFLYGSTRGIKIPRVERINGNWRTVWYDPFCPKACSLIGTNLPKPLVGRSLFIELWPMKFGEEVDKVNSFDQELMNEFKTLRRKLARWSNDTAIELKNAKPLAPPAFINRPTDNWAMLWAIAELEHVPPELTR